MGWTHHEVGKVDVGRMANILQLARECGFSVPFSRAPPPRPAAAAAAKPYLVAAAGVGEPRGNEDTVGGDTPRGFEGVRAPGKGGVENAGRLVGDDGGRGMSLPRPGGVSVAASGPSYGSRCVQAGGLSPHPPLAGRSDAACNEPIHGVGAGVAVARERRGQRQQKEEKGNVQGESSACWAEAVSRRKYSAIVQAAKKHGGDFPGAGTTQASGVRVVGERAETVDGWSSEGVQLQRQLPPARCRVVVVGAGASGLSAAACLRARGEDGVVILERCDGCRPTRTLPVDLKYAFPRQVPRDKRLHRLKTSKISSKQLRISAPPT